jgi:small ligand-binding sensory domain FIST
MFSLVACAIARIGTDCNRGKISRLKNSAGGSVSAGTPGSVEGALRAAHSQLEIVIAGVGSREMRIGAALSTDPDPAKATEAAVEEARSRLGGAEVSLALVVASRHHAASAEIASEVVRVKAGPERVIGCVAETVVGGDREVEGGPAVAVWLASLPKPVETFHMEFVRTSEGGVFGGYRFEEAGPGPYLLIGDPFSFPTDLLLGHVNERVPGTVVMGGMASGGIEPGDTRLFLDERVVDTGAVGARVPGIRIRALVSQGCRPIGNVYTVTRAEGNIIHELGGRPPLHRLQELVETLPPEDRELVGRGLHVGRVIDEYKAELERGDFLIRGVVGVDPQSGALAVGDRIEAGETIQFHVRDAATADEDLRTLLEREAEPAAGALLFTCNGRGKRLFSVPDHDASLVSEKLGGLPLAGFNCAGEIGPVGGKNFLHGFTASIALFVDP